MPERTPIPPPPMPGLTLSDIYYVLFRHKWKILIISATGLIAACLLPLAWKRPYQSEAKLLIRYVLDNRSLVISGPNDPKVKTPDERGENIINTELEILTSLDLAKEVVTNVGAGQILAKLGGGNSVDEAAARVRRGLLPDVPKKSNVIRLVFQHPDPEMAKQVLEQIVDVYKKKHVAIHQSGSVTASALGRERDNLKSELKGAEAELQRAKSNYNIISLDDSKKGFTEQMGKLQAALLEAESELAERKESVIQLTQLLHPGAPSPFQANGTNGAAAPSEPAESASNSVRAASQLAVASSNAVAATTATTNAPVSTKGEPAAVKSASTDVPPDKLAEYKRLGGLLETLNKQLEALNVAFTPESSRVQSARAQVADAEAKRTQLETDYPGLLVVKATETKAADSSGGPRVDLVAETARVSGLVARIKVLNTQLERLNKQGSVFNVAEGEIVELQRKKDEKEAQYKMVEATVDRTTIEDQLGQDRVSNIGDIQSPSLAFQDKSKLTKVMAMVFFGGIGGALALAFFIEFYLDRSLRRPGEIEARYGLPLFVSIPLLNFNGKPRRLMGFGKRQLLLQKNSPETPAHAPTAHLDLDANTARGGAAAEALVVDPDAAAQSNGHAVAEVHPADPLHPAELSPFFEALRDRLILYFEMRNLTHKPKLVAVTSCREGSGVTTTAAGLAATLSETGDGNVLLVDMNPEGGARQFFRGRLACTLDDALESGKREEAQVQENLYMVSESAINGDKLPRVLPKRFKHLMPRLRASDYDYIIFDMPPISQISATPRLARFMDMVFVVVESEKTDRDMVKRATDMLAETKANLGIILNKSKTYVPKQLHQEL